jgi:hypothetical protein
MGDDASLPHVRHGSARGNRRSARTGSSTLTPPTGLPSLDDAQVVAPPPPAPPEPTAGLCVCRHPKAVHEHWRRGTDCGICGVSRCRAFRKQGGALRRFLRRVGLAR